MLDGIDDVDWESLDHPYKGEVHLPDILRRVAGPDSDDAMAELYSTILHQGTIYPATAAAVPFLVDLARHSPYARADVLWLLGDIVDLEQPDGPAVKAALEREVPLLLDLLDDDAADVRAAVAFPLARAGARAEFLLRRWAVEVETDVLVCLAFALGEVYVREARPVLADAAVNGSPAVAMAAALALLRAGLDWPAGTIPALAEAIDREPDLPRSWVDGDGVQDLLVSLTAELAIDLLERMVRSAEPATRIAAMYAIADRCIARRSAPALFIPMVGPALRDEDPKVRWAAFQTLSRSGAAAAQFADELYAHLTEEVAPEGGRSTWHAALQTLMSLGDPRWVGPACAAAVYGLRLPYRSALLTPATLDAVRSMLHAEPVQAGLLAEVVAHWGAREAVPELLAGLPYADWTVTQALLALGHDDPAVLDHLKILADRDDMRAAAAVWRLIGDAEPLQRLSQKVLAGSSQVRFPLVVLTSDMGAVLRPLLPAAKAALATSWLPESHQFAARLVATAGNWEDALPAIRAGLEQGGSPAAEAAQLVADLASTHPGLACLEPELRHRLGDPLSCAAVVRALAQFGVSTTELTGPLLQSFIADYRTDALPIVLKMHAVEVVPVLEKLVSQDERLYATNSVPDSVWADELLRERIEQVIKALRK